MDAVTREALIFHSALRMKINIKAFHRIQDIYTSIKMLFTERLCHTGSYICHAIPHSRYDAQQLRWTSFKSAHEVHTDYVKK